MMKLSTMVRVVATTDADGRSDVADRILESWGHDRGSARFFRSSANVLFVSRKDGTPYFLRFAADSERRREEVEAEVDVLRFVAASGLEVAAPVASRNDRFVETIETRVGVVHAVVLTALEGDVLEMDELALPQFRRWGAALARLHAVHATLPDPLVVRRRSWKDDLRLAGLHVATSPPAVRREVDLLGEMLAGAPAEPAHFGLIHFDFELDNLVWTESGIGMLDFDQCARYWYAADIAFALGDLFEERFDPANAAFQAFMAGYGDERAVDPDLLAAIPTFLRLHHLLRYAGLRRALDLPSMDGQDEWVVQLWNKLASRVQAYEDSLSPTG